MAGHFAAPDRDLKWQDPIIRAAKRSMPIVEKPLRD